MWSPLGRHEVRGIAEPAAAWAVEGVSDSESRFEAVRTARLTDFIGREDELDFLLERQRLAWKGEGQIVLISGEPGIGRSQNLPASLRPLIFLATKQAVLRATAQVLHDLSRYLTATLRPFSELARALNPISCPSLAS
jgi:hypothetical protein